MEYLMLGLATGAPSIVFPLFFDDTVGSNYCISADSALLVVPYHIKHDALETTVASIESKAFHQLVQENDVAAISGMDSEGCTPPSFLAVLDLQHWTHLLDATIAQEEKGLQMLEEIRDKLYDIILADGSIEDLDNKIRVIEMASPNANIGNANTPDNDVMMSMPALFLKRKSLVSRLPRPEAGVASI
ncbi:unnamed protein product [Sphagnum balticum]